MTKSQYQSLLPGELIAVRYQYLGREQVQKGWRSTFIDGKICIKNGGRVSYKSVDLIK